ncbi:MAG TPA: class I SAM-dependent methyltransferase [Pyrinomonadaceae bacterium]
MEDKSLVADKFTARARGWSENEYADPSSFMERRAALVQRWGTPLCSGDRILEIGCGDGSLSCLLARQGFEVTGVDISRGMIEEAKGRADRERVAVRFEVADIDSFEVVEPYDGLISFMSAFFTYLENPSRFIEATLPFVRKKMIVDWNFRSPCTFVEAAQQLRRAGLERVEWRPWFIRHTPSLGVSASRLRGWIEGKPNLALLLLRLKRWHYTVYLKGEKDQALEQCDASSDGKEFHGHSLPSSILQRSLIRPRQGTQKK